ncbi:hypothetical protein ACH5RR_002803 [Cinchona calisaya]|uniref:Gag protein n=1 Tax=Cinchona calisaya TaxID=153742 RepID=A0ABD3ATM6_9GENT
MIVGEMASKNIIADLKKGEKMNGTNYDIWLRKVMYFLNKQELLDHLTNSMIPPEAGNTAQYRRDLEAFEAYKKRDRSVHFTLLSCMHDDLIGEFEPFPTAKEIGISSVSNSMAQ